jgi:DNA polymerase-4
MKSPFVLHIDIDAFFAAAEVMLNPRLKGKPVIVGGMPDERGVVCTASYEARAYGVHSGMALRTAAQKCPRGIFLRGRFHLYSQISKRFFDCLHRLAPSVEGVSVDEAYLDLRGMQYLYPSVYEMAQEIKIQVEKEIGLRVSAGLGFSKLGAKLATEMAKPGGFFFIADERDFISNLSLGKIPGVGSHTLLILQGLGIRTVKELESAYPSIWKKIIGPHLYSSSRYPKSERAEGKSFSRETTFPEDIADRDMVISHLSYLVDRLSVHLIDNRLFVSRIEVKARFSDFSTFTRRTALEFPTNSFHQMWKVALFLLDELLKKKKLSLRLVGVKVEDIFTRRDILPFINLKSERLGHGVRDIRKRFGFSAIFIGRQLFLGRMYPIEKEGVVLKTASLTK